MRAQFPIQLAKEHILLEHYTEALLLLRPEAERGHPDAQFLYGYLRILNPSLSPADGRELIFRAAEQGHANANYVLATVHDFEAEYQFEIPSTENQWQQLRFAARKGSIAAKVMQAQAYEDGVFVSRNLRAAYHLLEQCIQRGHLIHVEASYRLGALLLNYPELQSARSESPWSALYRTILHQDDYDVIVKARHLLAERSRLARYKPERQKILGYIQEINRSFRRLTPVSPRPEWQRFLHDYCHRTLLYDLQGVSFEEFVSFLFDHPLRQEEDGQRWEKNWEFIVSLELDYHMLIKHYIRLFHEPEFLLEHYTPEQLDQGFWFAMGNVGQALAHESVSAQEVEQCFQAMYDLFAKLFMVMTNGHASHMWWESNFYEAERYSYKFKHQHRHDNETTIQHFRDVMLDVLTRILQLDSIACKAHALHGLNHLDHPGKKQVILDFFEANTDLPDYEQWYQYGMAAIEGKAM